MGLHTQTRLWINGGLMAGPEVFDACYVDFTITVIIQCRDVIRKGSFRIRPNLIPAAPPPTPARPVRGSGGRAGKAFVFGGTRVFGGFLRLDLRRGVLEGGR